MDTTLDARDDDGLLGHVADPPPAGGSTSRLTSQDVALGQILLVMLAFGGMVGVVYPYLVGAFIEVRPGRELAFRLACVVAGFCVGGFAYAVARLTLHRANRRLALLAAFDGLTGLLNRRNFLRALGAELVRADRGGDPMSLIIADLDHFKQVNDRHGHLTGDDVLAAVARDISQSVRPYDVACRIGGEEFAVILPRTSATEARDVAERIRTLVGLTDHGDLPEVTISLGVATFPDDGTTIRTLVSRADDAMYAAKDAGRNAVRTWSPAKDPSPAHASG
jgi:diguanylate cyclase (GGDEF)-like protein